MLYGGAVPLYYYGTIIKILYMIFNGIFCPTDVEKFELIELFFVKHVFQLNTTSFSLLLLFLHINDVPKNFAPNGNGRYRCCDLICAVRNGLQLNDIWDEVKARFPGTKEFICVGRLP